MNLCYLRCFVNPFQLKTMKPFNCFMKKKNVWFQERRLYHTFEDEAKRYTNPHWFKQHIIGYVYSLMAEMEKLMIKLINLLTNEKWNSLLDLGVFFWILFISIRCRLCPSRTLTALYFHQPILCHSIHLFLVIDVAFLHVYHCDVKVRWRDKAQDSVPSLDCIWSMAHGWKALRDCQPKCQQWHYRTNSVAHDS